MFSTPILSNGGTTRGLPISCFLNYVPDSRRGLSDHYDENIWLASSGGGIGGYWGNVRSNGIGTSNHSRSTGSIPFMHVVDSQMLAFNQGVTRRGSYAAYMDISHPEVEEFINMRKESGGDINRKCLNIHNAINITNEYLDAVKNDEDWRIF
jgi:ribonucleoside-diphosphate reductase alpha chain